MEWNTPCKVTAEQVATYRRDGHILLENVLPAKYIPPYHKAIVQTVAERNKETRKLADRDTYGKAFLQTTNLWQYNELVKEYVMAERFAGIAARLMSVDKVRLYHDQALFKEAGGGITPWHQDQHYWPLATDKTITMWMTLADIDAAMGTLQFASGSHVEGYLGDIPISDDSETQLRAFVQSRGFRLQQADSMTAGSATFHSGWTLHSAPPNTSDRMRPAMTVIYFADGARVSELDNKNRVADRDHWLPGTQPGDLAATRLNPALGW
ncbi:MAG: phytanoyl-CoA dioxygenase family protein [Chloroflexi bacterium]|nr:phytanoyl-CoA dioxygenase family protein [Chloroflexota bacterium]